MTEFKIGDVIVEISGIQKWVVYTEPESCTMPGLERLRIKPIMWLDSNVFILGSPRIVSSQTAHKFFVKVGRARRWREPDRLEGNDNDWRE